MLAAVLATVSPARADVPTPALLLSHFETDIPGNTINRDAGWSAPVPGSPGNSLWLFGDSGWTGGFWYGTTAAIGPATRGQVPTGLTEILTPPLASPRPSSRGPSGLLPGFPDGLRTASGQSCDPQAGQLTASWPAGAITIPGTTRMLVTSADVCEESAEYDANGHLVEEGHLTDERFVVTEYTPSNNTLGTRTRVFTNTAGLPVQQQLGSPIVSGGFLYLTGSVCDAPAFFACSSGRVFLARVQADATHWRDASAYRWWNGSTWSSSYSAAASILPGAVPVGSGPVSLGDYSAVGKGFAIVTQTSGDGHFTIWRSTSLTGGWTATGTGQVPCSGGSGADLNLCRALIGHPELSTTGNLLLSYYNPAENHVRVAAVAW